MNGRNSVSRMSTSIGFLLTFGCCIDASADSIKWQEEVLLHDGKKIVIERTYTVGGYPTLDSRERKSLDQIVTFNVSGSKEKVIWKTDFRESTSEPGSLNLLLLDVVDQTPYIAAYPTGSISYSKWGSPNPPYVFFKFERSAWRRIALEEFPHQLVKANVIVGRPPANLLKPFYTTEDVERQNYDIHTTEYKIISRTPLDHWKPKPIYSGPKAPHPIASSSAIDDKKK